MASEVVIMCKSPFFTTQILLVLLIQMMGISSVLAEGSSSKETCPETYNAYNIEEFWDLYESGINECIYLRDVTFDNLSIDELILNNSTLVLVNFVNTYIEKFHLKNVRIESSKFIKAEFGYFSTIKDTRVEGSELIGTNFATIKNKGGVSIKNIVFGCHGDPEFEIYHYPKILAESYPFPCSSLSKDFILEDENNYNSNVFIRDGEKIRTIYIDHEEFDEDLLIHLAKRHRELGYYSEAKEFIYLSKHLRVVNSVIDFDEMYLVRFGSNYSRCSEVEDSQKEYECEKGVTTYTKIKALIEYYIFDVTSRYGLEPDRTLYIWMMSVFFFCIIYLVLSIEFKKAHTIDKIMLRNNSEEKRLSLPQPELKSSIASALHIIWFSYLNSLNFGIGNAKVKNFFSRLQSSDFTYTTTGLIRFISGLQIIVSLVLFAIFFYSIYESYVIT